MEAEPKADDHPQWVELRKRYTEIMEELNNYNFLWRENIQLYCFEAKLWKLNWYYSKQINRLIFISQTTDTFWAELIRNKMKPLKSCYIFRDNSTIKDKRDGCV